MRKGLVALVPLLAAAALAVAGSDDPKPKKPTLNVRAIPRLAFSPATVLFSVDLEGGDDVEQYYCPEIEWDWGDGGKSVQEGDCPPFEAGVSKIQRHFSVDKEFRRAGTYSIAVSLKRADKTFAKSSVKVTVRPGLGDPTREPE